MARDDDRERAAGGEFTTETSLAEVREVLATNTQPSLMTGEVAEALDISDESARQKLLSLYEEGHVTRRKAGRQVLWWVPASAVDSEDQRPAVVDVTHDVYSGDAAATFANDVVLTVTDTDPNAGAGYTCELTHPTVETETWGDDTVERPPAEVLIEILSDFYNAEDRDLKASPLDRFMAAVNEQ